MTTDRILTRIDLLDLKYQNFIGHTELRKKHKITSRSYGTADREPSIYVNGKEVDTIEKNFSFIVHDDKKLIASGIIAGNMFLGEVKYMRLMISADSSKICGLNCWVANLSQEAIEAFGL